jgi:hypothetical protein
MEIAGKSGIPPGFPQPTSMHPSIWIVEGNPMSTRGTEPQDHEIVVRNTKKIAKLIHEVQKLVELLEAQRLVEPVTLFQLKRELLDIQKSE